MHACRGAFRRRNSFLHQLENAIEADELDEATEADGAIGAGGADEISRRSR